MDRGPGGNIVRTGQFRWLVGLRGWSARMLIGAAWFVQPKYGESAHCWFWGQHQAAPPSGAMQQVDLAGQHES